MKYRVKNDINIALLKEGGLLEEILKSRGVENPSHYLNLTDDDISPSMEFKGMEKAIRCLYYHISNNSKIHIIADVDADGVTSCSIMYQYIKDINPAQEISFHMNEGKAHGILLKELKDFIVEDGMLIIAPDCGSNDKSNIKQIQREYDVDFLIIDHHEYEIDSCPINCMNIAFVNNQYEDSPNRHLCGAGMVYKLIKQYDIMFNYNYADKYLDLVALGLIGDSMDLRDYECRRIVDKGLMNIQNEFIKLALLSRDNAKTWEEYNKDNINIKNIAFYVTPLINGCVRSGTKKERLKMIRAIMGMKEECPYQPRKKGGVEQPLIMETLQQSAIRTCTSAKRRQDASVKKITDKIINDLTEEDLGNKVLFLQADNIKDYDSSFSGLIANKICNHNKVQRPVFILKDDGDDYGGSARNYHMFEETELQTILNNSGLATGQGHEGAFGVSIPKSNLVPLQNYFNEQFKDTKIESVYTVDYRVQLNRLSPKDIINVGRYDKIFGVGNLSKPTFVIEQVSIDVKDIQLLGSKQNMLKLTKKVGDREYKFLKVGSSEEYAQLIGKQKGFNKSKPIKTVTFDFICEFEINRYNDQEYTQIKIIDYNYSHEQVQRRRF